MYRISHEPLAKHVALIVAVLIAVPYGLAPTAAYGQAFTEMTSAVVLPIQDITGHDSFKASEKATDAVAMALEDSGEFRTIAKRSLHAALADLGLVPPLMETQQVRLGEYLQVDKVITGTVHEVAVDRGTGQCRVRLELKAMDVFLGWVLDGAMVSVETAPIPGWRGDDATVVNEALRQVAEAAVRTMLRHHVPRGKIDSVDNHGIVTMNIGLNNGVHDGQNMVVVRADWNPDLQRVKARAVGEITVFDVQARFSKGRAIGDSLWPRTGDYIYAQYTPSEVVRERQHRQSITKTIRKGWAFAMLLGVLAIGMSKGTTKPPVVDAQIGQAGLGLTPFIRVNLDRGLIPETSQVHAWLFYRGESAGLIAEPENIVGATSEPRLDFYEDTAPARLGVIFSTSFQYLDRNNEMADGSVDITYDDPALVTGDTYFYKVARVVDPIQPVPPVVGSAGVRATRVGPAQEEEEEEEAAQEVDPPDALSEASRAAGPVTYFEPAILEEPDSNTGGINPTSVTFEWTPSVRADQYQVQVYDSPTLSWPPVYTSGDLSWTGSNYMTHTVTDYTFDNARQYWWVVGNRKIGEADPISYVAGEYRTGWIYSSVFTFTTAEGPPSPPSSAAVGGSDRPARHPASRSGLWHERGQEFGDGRR